MENNTVILVLDHVRAKRPYVRTVSKWVQDLDLRGVFVFQRKLILLVLQGHSENIKEYLSRHRTQCIDVDSGGKKCKERMMTVIAELEFPVMADKFVVKDLESSEELKSLFIEDSLLGVMYRVDIAPATLQTVRRKLEEQRAKAVASESEE